MNLPEIRTASAAPAVQHPLSVCCVTRVSPQHTRGSLAPLRAVASEIVVGLDERWSAAASEYEKFADRVLILPSDGVERGLAEIHQACTHDWVLRLEPDETVSPALLAKLPQLLADDAVRHYAISRRWIVDDGAHWVDEAPWWPDFQVRLIRSGGASISGQPAVTEMPCAFVMEPMLYLDCLPQTALGRQTRALHYGVMRPGGPGTLSEPEVLRFEPERFARRAPVPLAGEERSAARAFLDASGGRVARWAARRPGGPNAPGSLVLSAGRPGCSQGTDGAGPTARSWRACAHRSRSRFGPEDSGVVPIDVAPPDRPGSVWIDLGVVDEHVRWLSGQQRVAAVIDPPSALPVRRDVRPPPRSRWWRRRARSAVAIPRVLHRIWLGAAPMPQAHIEYGDSWRRLHPDWELRVWTDADAPTPPGVERARNVAERADLIRYEVLRRHGGVYVDTDVECLRPIDSLLEGVAAFAAYEVPGRLCNAVIGAAPGHAAFTRATELAAVTVGQGTYPQATATAFLTYVLERFEDVTLFGPERFYPTLWEGTQNVGEGAPYTAHHWARSWDASHDQP